MQRPCGLRFQARSTNKGKGESEDGYDVDDYDGGGTGSSALRNNSSSKCMQKSLKGWALDVVTIQVGYKVTELRIKRGHYIKAPICLSSFDQN